MNDKIQQARKWYHEQEKKGIKVDNIKEAISLLRGDFNYDSITKSRELLKKVVEEKEKEFTCICLVGVFDTMLAEDLGSGITIRQLKDEECFDIDLRSCRQVRGIFYKNTPIEHCIKIWQRKMNNGDRIVRYYCYSDSSPEAANCVEYIHPTIKTGWESKALVHGYAEYRAEPSDIMIALGEQ